MVKFKIDYQIIYLTVPLFKFENLIYELGGIFGIWMEWSFLSLFTTIPNYLLLFFNLILRKITIFFNSLYRFSSNIILKLKSNFH